MCQKPAQSIHTDLQHMDTRKLVECGKVDLQYSFSYSFC